MELYQALILIAVGLFAGFVNTVAGGGSLLTLPVMIFMGLPPIVANATNRLALLFQNISAVAGFRSKGISTWPYNLYLSITAVIGAMIGAKISVELDPLLFSRILSVIMVAVIGFMVFNPLKKKTFEAEKMDRKHQIIGVILFFGVGLYGGFIQAGVGFIVIAVLSMVNNMRLVRANSAKVFVILFYTIAALGVFIYEGVINWQWGLTLAVGNTAGGWIGSRWQVEKGEVWIRRILMVMVVMLAIKLWFFG